MRVGLIGAADMARELDAIERGGVRAAFQAGIESILKENR